MADLQIDADSLRAAASKGDAIAADLVSESAPCVASGQPSEAGVSAFDAATTAIQTHQSERISDNAGKLHASAASYTTVDSDGADQIARTV